MLLQAASLPTCIVKLALLPPEEEKALTPSMEQALLETSLAISSLKARGVTVFISLQAISGSKLPSPTALGFVAPVVQEVAYAPAPCMASSWIEQDWEHFTVRHLSALRHARHQLEVLCIPNARSYDGLHSLHSIASFTQLKTLVLKCHCSSTASGSTPDPPYPVGGPGSDSEALRRLQCLD